MACAAASRRRWLALPYRNFRAVVTRPSVPMESWAHPRTGVTRRFRQAYGNFFNNNVPKALGEPNTSRAIQAGRQIPIGPTVPPSPRSSLATTVCRKSWMLELRFCTIVPSILPVRDRVLATRGDTMLRYALLGVVMGFGLPSVHDTLMDHECKRSGLASTWVRP